MVVQPILNMPIKDTSDTLETLDALKGTNNNIFQFKKLNLESILSEN
jgi:hypothetical protein